jgi:hypothetical protein
MTSKHLIAFTLAATTLSFGQIKMPKLSDMKDKMTQKNAAPAPAGTETAAATTPSPATSAAAPAVKEEPFTPLAPGPMKGGYPGQAIELTMCEKGAKEGQWDVACTKPARTFQYKGSVTNVFGTLRFTPPLTNKSTRLKVVIYKKDVMDEYREVTFNPGGRTASVGFTKGPGLYMVKIVDQYDGDKVFLTDQFVVSPDTIGDRAIDNVKAGTGKLMVCSEIDDNWKCVNEATTWNSKKPFNLYVRLPQAISGLAAGWSVFKQNPDGTDGNLEYDLLQGTQGRAAYWATTNGNYLKPGVYTIYSIAWTHRTTIGNIKDYFAKTTLTVR